MAMFLDTDSIFEFVYTERVPQWNRVWSREVMSRKEVKPTPFNLGFVHVRSCLVKTSLFSLCRLNGRTFRALFWSSTPRRNNVGGNSGGDDSALCLVAVPQTVGTRTTPFGS